jgi:glyoxylase-like metal-dependent hydrolase (beta-lactamase superfamily II)/rhodanese-related sulfurtransferase
MLLKHYYVEKIAHSSYIVAGNESCAVVDPSRDVDLYIEEAEKLGVKITHILETHLHADFLSGHIELAEKTGATMYFSKAGEAQFDHVDLEDGDKFKLEDMEFEVIETPGHTPEHITYIIRDLSRSEDPVGIFCGDTLFVGDAGRPDLFPDRKEELAKKLYDSLFNKIFKLPDYVEVYPAHGEGSLCGKAMGAKYRSTIGYERKHNPVLQHKEIDDFVKNRTEDMPEVPDHFARCSALNAKGPLPIYKLTELKKMKAEEFYEKSQEEDTFVLDTRSYTGFGGQHVPKSYNIDFISNLPTFAGWVLPPDKKILLVAEDKKRAEESALWLYRVGIDNVIGYIDGSMKSWLVKAYETDTIPQLHPSYVDEYKDDDEYIIVDGRDKKAYQENHVEGAVNIPSPDLRTRHTELDKNKKIVVYCNSGARSSLGASILKAKGFENVYNLGGGIQSYMAYKDK